ncbi:murein hydrolase activator EnvC family protein [Oerskovia flava]|uniref:murein hydrolase activator EnvC family protein n=1 Tax=Oerskovia flava TaxID=2986422 RepID=UPI00223EED54|nr:M23 family metallopeptidase [Oerskovia sp. JB1-3-2]
MALAVALVHLLLVSLLAPLPAAGADPPAGPAGGAAWVFPVGGSPAPPVLAPFEPPAQQWLAGHRGVDLGAEVGDVVVSPADGVVTFAGTVVDRGVLVVLHDDGLRTSLEPVTASAAPGARVARGAAVGVVQDVPGHCAPRTCLHWGVRRGETYLDPLSFVTDRPPIVLLPDR